jgi:hypothetical protein
MVGWTVVNGEQVMVIESTDKGLVSIGIPSGTPFVAGVAGIRDVRTKLGLAIGAVSGDRTEPGSGGAR